MLDWWRLNRDRVERNLVAEVSWELGCGKTAAKS